MNNSLYLIPIFVILFIFTCGFNASAQCPSSVELIFASQQDVDAFAVNYPNCTQLPMTVRIGTYAPGSNITDLSPLNQIELVGGSLAIVNNPLLTSLNGLENLFFIGSDIIIRNNAMLADIGALSAIIHTAGLEINNNSVLPTLTGLENLVGVAYVEIENNPLLSSLGNLLGTTSLNALTIISNDALVDLTGLESITSVEGIASIIDNDALMNLSGLDGLRNVQTLNVEDNNSLSNLNGLQNLTKVRNVGIASNPSLTSLSGLESLNEVNFIAIHDNETLVDISAIGNVDYEGIASLILTENDNLSTCNIPIVCSYIINFGRSIIENNATNCSSEDVIINNCGLPFPTCPTLDLIDIRTQERVDLFGTRYPNCETIAGNLEIGDFNLTDINDLSAFNRIKTINGQLRIHRADISDMQGFSSLEYVQSLGLIGNPSLYNLNGLENLTTVNGSFIIENNFLLSNIDGLDNLTSINGPLIIDGNDSLFNLSGLSNIDYNTVTNLIIRYNDNLSVCYVEPICVYIAEGGNSSVYENASGCNSAEEIQASCIALPVELTHFTAETQRGGVRLTWQTASETNNQGFDIQRSKDGINWEKIGYQQGAGNSTSTQDYRHNDTQPLSGINYYRLKQIDIEGDFIYSDIVSVSYGNKGFAVFPVPAKDAITLQLESPQTTVKIRISNIIGEVIHTQDLQLSEGVNQFTFDISEYTNGIYFLTINNGDKNGTQRFVKH